MIGLNFAGPMIYKGRKDSLKQAYILLITCSLSRAVHLELVGSQKIEEFIRAFRCFVATRGRPERIYPDNANTFKAAATWIKSIRKSEFIHDYLAENHITWQLNLSKAPWWGISLNEWLVWWSCIYTKLLESLIFPGKNFSSQSFLNDRLQRVVLNGR